MDWEAVSDAELSRRCRRGHPDAWRELVRRCAPTAYRIAVHVLRDADAAEDACQEVFLRMYRYFDSYDPSRTLGPWVAKITYNVCLRRREGVVARATRPVAPELLDRRPEPHAADPEGATATREASAHLAHAMEALADEDRALLAMRYREGLSDAEVAHAVGMPVNTVKTRIFRARGQLRTRLGRLLRGDEP